MNKAFEKHRDKRISEIHERLRNYRSIKKVEIKSYRQRIKKA
jgi:hypothetical protein